MRRFLKRYRRSVGLGLSDSSGILDGLSDWAGPGVDRFQSRRARWWRFLRTQIVPPRGQRVVPTMAGFVLIIVAVALGLAAYNTGSNILFITLSLLLSTLALSALLSWVNFSGCRWRMAVQLPFRVGETAVVSLHVENGKDRFPSYCLWFDMEAKVSGQKSRLGDFHRLDPGGKTRLDWIIVPQRRGRDVIEVTSAGSWYPFGFLNRRIAGRLSSEIRVWPQRIAYQWSPERRSNDDFQGERTPRAGSGQDFVHLRKYQPGDSHRQIHWKASARLGQLMVRNLEAETQAGYLLWVDASRERWTVESFETMCRVAASLADDLFRRGELRSVALGSGRNLPIRKLADLDYFLDELSILEPVEESSTAPQGGRGAVIRFAPAGGDRIIIYVGNSQAGAA